MLLNTLLVIYASLMLLDTLFMVALHFLHDRKGYYKTAAGIWVGLFAAFAMDGVISAKSVGLHHLFGISFANIMSFNMGRLASDIYGLNLPSGKILKASLSLWVIALVMHFGFGVGFTPTAFVICTGIAIAPVLAAYRIVRSTAKLTIIDRLFAFLLLAEGFHMLDYPFLRNIEGAAVFGFSFGLVLVYLASMLIPVVINRRLSADFNEVLQKTVEEKTMDLNQVQQQLFNSSKLASLGEMAGGVAHEINNPIATVILRARHIKGLVERIDRDPGALKSSLGKISDFADTILNTGNRIADIVSGLKTFSRSGEVDPFQVETVAKILGDTLALSMSRMISKEIQVVQNVDPSVAIECRPVQISQVVLNILGNATYELGRVDGRPRVIKVDVYREGQEAIIAITDNGRGISAEAMEKVMQPFFTTKPIGEGTGLGLSISKGIVESHKGSLEVSSQPGNTCFKIRIPIASAKSAVAGEAA